VPWRDGSRALTRPQAPYRSWLQAATILTRTGPKGDAEGSYRGRRTSKKHRLISPRRGFYLILRPEDQVIGAPSPERWIASLMDYLHSEYRISLLRAAAFHGSSHQAAMVFQVMAPKQIKDMIVGQHRIQFIYQEPNAFEGIDLNG
jgi:hypothetical protein